MLALRLSYKFCILARHLQRRRDSKSSFTEQHERIMFVKGVLALIYVCYATVRHRRNFANASCSCMNIDFYASSFSYFRTLNLAVKKLKTGFSANRYAAYTTKQNACRYSCSMEHRESTVNKNHRRSAMFAIFHIQLHWTSYLPRI